MYGVYAILCIIHMSSQKKKKNITSDTHIVLSTPRPHPPARAMYILFVFYAAFGLGISCSLLYCAACPTTPTVCTGRNRLANLPQQRHLRLAQQFPSSPSSGAYSNKKRQLLGLLATPTKFLFGLLYYKKIITTAVVLSTPPSPPLV